ncbi:hypothetical protein GP486_001833 [Trichoglossum hirsutum]|uniref:CHAT domain-containing protein n=1 Tax=Trichoglossum hirsutum TaxID=265104 RepID=A0A9P8LG34_9PEZI|nr:hypothetical protein GP486_001833 [Trichoglossum hirsutum]
MEILDRRFSADRISISAVELLSDFPKRSWTIRLESSRTGRKSKVFTLIDPFSEVDYEELRWYMEDYALQDPFAHDRATRVTQNLDRYATLLITALRPSIEEVTLLEDANTAGHQWESLHFLIFGDGTLKSLHSLRWELLEREQCWADILHPALFATVSRISGEPSDVRTQQSGTCSTRPFRILYVSSRPGLEEDVSYRAISRQIWALIETRTIDHLQPQMQFVRPGTWRKFKDMLGPPGDGHFDVVHFDMHGIIKKRAGKATARLHFSNTGAASTDPDPKTAKAIAQELTRCGVKSVVLNACNAATTGFSVESNFAHVLAAQGIPYVVAMPYKVKTDAAALAMRTFYSILLTESGSFMKATRCARAELRRLRGRAGRYGTTVDCDDEYNLVCYCAKPEVDFTPITGGLHYTMYSQNAALAGPYSDSTLKPVGSGLGRHIPNIIRIQDLDILSLEELLVGNSVVFVTGESGTGKSTLARNIQSWWRGTSFARYVEYFEVSGDLQNWRDGIHQKGILQSDPNEGFVGEAGSYDYDRVFLLDDIDPWEMGPQENSMKYFLSSCVGCIKKCRIILFTRMTKEVLTGRYPWAPVHEISIPSSEEATALAKFHLLGQRPSYELSHTDAGDLEELVKHHRMNLSFIEIFMPRMAELYLLPKDFVGYLLRHPSSCDFAAFHDRISCQDSYPVLGLVHERLQAWGKSVLAFRIAFPLCMFQQRVPQDIRPWLYKLWEKGLFSGGKLPFEPYPLESGRIHAFELEPGWGSFPPDWAFEDSWVQVQECLQNSGLLQKEKTTFPGLSTYSRIHPILPYFLRYEIARLGLRDSYWPDLLGAYWEYYEVRAADLTLSFLEDESRYSTVMDINNDLVNLHEAINLSTMQKCFPFRIMRSYNLISFIDFTSMTKVQLRRWQSLFDQVLTRFERIVLEKEWSNSQPQDFKQKMVIYAMTVARCTGKLLEELGSSSAVLDNAERALILRNNLTKDLVVTDQNIEAIFYTIQVQRAKATPTHQWSPDTLNLFHTLLLTKASDNVVGERERIKLANAELANHLAADRDKIPSSHPLHAILGRAFENGRAFIQSIHLNNGVLAQHLSLSGRAAMAYTVGQEQEESASIMNDFTSREHAAQTIRGIQAEFSKRVPSSNSGYSNDARAFTIDADAYLRGDEFFYDRGRLRQVYEIAQQQKDTKNHLFCLNQLFTAALLDGDLGAAQNYDIALQKLEEELVLARQLDGNEVVAVSDNRQLLLDNTTSSVRENI